MAWIISNLPNWIQAIAAVALVALTLATLLVLYKYAADTKRIADISASQTENSQMPLLIVAMRENAGGWVMENQGFGPALNILYSVYDQGGQKSMRSTPPMGRGAIRENLHQTIAATLGRHKFEMKYELLSGLEYRTEVEIVDGATQTQFYKPGTDRRC